MKENKVGLISISMNRTGNSRFKLQQKADSKRKGLNNRYSEALDFSEKVVEFPFLVGPEE